MNRKILQNRMAVSDPIRVLSLGAMTFSDLTSADELAAEWAAQLDAGPLGPKEEADFRTWLASDPRNPARLDGFLRLYGRMEASVPMLVAEGTLHAMPEKSRIISFPRWA